MASSTITRVGGVVIVTQVIPQDEKNAVSLKDSPIHSLAPPAGTEGPPTATVAPPAATQAPPPAPEEKKDKMTTEFLRGEPVILGVFQLYLGLMCVLFGLTAFFSRVVLLHAPVCSSIIFVIAGCVTLRTAKTTTPLTVRVTASWSMLSSILSVGGVAYLSWLLAGPSASQRLCEGVEYDKCFRSGSLWALNSVVTGLQILVLVLMIMELAFSLTVSIFSMKAVKLRSSEMYDNMNDDNLLHPE